MTVPLFLLSVGFFVCCLDSGSPLVIGISNPGLIGDVILSRKSVSLPLWHQTRVMESSFSSDTVEEETGTGVSALVIDTLGAFVDSISLTLLPSDVSNSEVVMMVYDGDVCIWTGQLFSNSTTQPQTLRVDFLEEIRAPAADKVKLIDTFTYNGDFVALWRVKYLFDLVDEFIIAEAAYTHSGLKKTTLFFQMPENVALFAPYMSKITYVVVQDCPPPPAYWKGLMEGHMARWDEEWEGFWRENYQKLFCRFFVRPPSASSHGKKSLVFVSDADEVLNVETMQGLILAEESLPPADPSSVFAPGKVVHPQMFCYFYNFNTVSMHAWEFPYLLSSESYENLEETLFLRVVHGEETVFVPDGGWHLSYFTTYPGFLRKIAHIAHLTIANQNNPTLSCEHIRDSIAHSTDLFGRGAKMVSLAARSSLAGDLSVHLLPPWWEGLQSDLEERQLASCECC